MEKLNFNDIKSKTSNLEINGSELNVTKDRHIYLGGSDIPIIMNVSSFTTPYELAKIKAEVEVRQDSSNIFTEYGHLCEPFIRDVVNKKLKTNFIPATLTIEELKFRANVDGYDSKMNGILEIKTNNGEDDNFEKYYPQIQFYLMCYNKEYCILAEYERDNAIKDVMFDRVNGDSKGFRKALPNNFTLDFDPNKVRTSVIYYDKDYIDKMIAQIEEFYKKVEAIKNNKITNEFEFVCFDTNTDNIIDNIEDIKTITSNLYELKLNEKSLNLAIENLKEKLGETTKPRKKGLSIGFVSNKPVYNDLVSKYATIDLDKIQEENNTLFNSLILKYGKTKETGGTYTLTIKQNLDFIKTGNVVELVKNKQIYTTYNKDSYNEYELLEHLKQDLKDIKTIYKDTLELFSEYKVLKAGETLVTKDFRINLSKTKLKKTLTLKDIPENVINELLETYPNYKMLDLALFKKKEKKEYELLQDEMIQSESEDESEETV